MTTLKGAIAVYIAIYHYYAWGVGQPADWGANLAQFGVVLFFTMSGYGLAQGYRGNVDWRRFWLRRLRRIVPWFWVATVAAALLGTWFGWRIFALNLAMLWPLANMNYGMATGSWAVGCEVVFYAFFWLWGSLGLFAPWLGWAAIALSTLFGWAALSPNVVIAAQWSAWISPLTQSSAFFAGALLVPHLTRSWLWPVLWVTLCLALPTPWAVSWLRPLLIVAGCGLVATAKEWRSLADILGRYSYQIYLLHPVVWHIFV
jgi:exopolysaccharide production protein ExoZ